MYVDLEFTRDTFYNFELRYAQKIGPHKLRLFWESDTRDREIIPAKFFYNRLSSTFTPYVLQVLPDISNATTTALASSVDYKDSIVGIKESHLIYVRDMFGNLQNHMDDIFRVTLV